MIVETKDVLRKILENMEADIEYRFFSEKAEAGLAPNELAPLHGYLEKGTLMAGLKENSWLKVDIREVFAEIWNSVAYFEFNGQRVCERKAYGKQMLALDEEFFKQGEYEKFVEESLLASKGTREIVVDDLSGNLPSSIMKDFMNWKAKGGE
ncbi:hypothetical protein [Lactococcus garvieae]